MLIRLTLGVLIATLVGCSAVSKPATSAATPTAVATTPSSLPTVASSAEPTASASPQAQSAGDLLIVPEERVGPITSTSSEASLKEAFGADQVKRESIYIGDGQSSNGVVIFPDQPDKRLEVLWFKDNPELVEMIQLHGETSQWKTADGVSLGTELVKLEELNGSPFELTGLGWDLGGAVTNWNGGRLQGLNLRVEASSVELTEEETAAITGDQMVKSDNPAMRKANPKVFKITVNFPFPDATPTP